MSLALLSGMDLPVFAADAPRDVLPLRLPLTFTQSNLVTTITVGDQTVQAGVDTSGGAITLSKEILNHVGARSLGDTVASTNSYASAAARKLMNESEGNMGRDGI